MNTLLKLAIGAILIAIPTTFAADGTISFLYFANGTTNDTPVTLLGVPIDSSYTVGLYGGNQVGINAAIPLATVQIFQNTGLFQYLGGDISIPGSTPGLPATVTLKVWKGPTFQQSLNFHHGEISFTTQPLGGPNPVPPPPAFTSPDLSSPTAGRGFHGMDIVWVPEPSTYVLSALGLTALGISRRRNFPK